MVDRPKAKIYPYRNFVSNVSLTASCLADPQLVFPASIDFANVSGEFPKRVTMKTQEKLLEIYF